MLKKSGNINEWIINGKEYCAGSVAKTRAKGRKFFIPVPEVETFPVVVVPTTNKKRKIFFTEEDAPLLKETTSILKPKTDKTNVTKLRAPKKWTDKHIVLADGKKYNGRNHWRENSSRAYLTALKHGWLDEVFPKKVQTKESVIDDSRKYKDRSEWRLKSFSAFDFAKRNGWLDEIFPIRKRGPRRKRGKYKKRVSASNDLIKISEPC